MGAIVLFPTGGFINLFTVTFWLNWRQLVLIFSSSSPPPFFFFFFIYCAYPCGGQREYLTKYFSLNQAESKGGFQGQLQCKMPFLTSIILSISSTLRREVFFHDTNYGTLSHTGFFHSGWYLLSQWSPRSLPVLFWWCELLTFGKLSWTSWIPSSLTSLITAGGYCLSYAVLAKHCADGEYRFLHWG